MKKYIVLGVNENPKYLYYLPLITWAWNKFGWTPIVFYSSTKGAPSQFGFICDFTINHKIDFIPAVVEQIDGYKSETLAQVVRLYGPCVAEQESYVMTSDVDMLPLNKNMFHYEGHRVLAIGRDLTDYHYPMCYVGARAYIWRQFMKMVGDDYNGLLRRDLRHQKNMWGLDQDILTERLLAYHNPGVNHVNRGVDPRTGYPLGRVDRSNWRLDHKILNDAHLPHDILTNHDSFQKVLALLHHVWPGEDFKWYVEFHKEFKKLL